MERSEDRRRKLARDGGGSRPILPSIGNPRVLVVDDNMLNVELVKFVLGSESFTVEVAPDAEQALVLINAFRPDIILMDIQMPGMNGLELTRRIKGDPATRAIVVLAFTAYAMKGDEERMRAAGCDGYISKPIEVESFARQVLAYLNRTPQAN